MAKKEIIILKLGGSVITEKTSRRLRIRRTVIRQLIKELSRFIQRSPFTKIILLHGAGSFGHPLVHRYQLLKSPLAGQRLLGFTKTINSTRCLTNLLAEMFQSANLPVLPLQSSALVGAQQRSIFFFNLPYIKKFLAHGFIPLFGGDMIINHENKAKVVSADELVVCLAQTLPKAQIVFATNVDGVFAEFPPLDKAKPFSFLSRQSLSQLLRQGKRQKSRYDVTGRMMGKLQTLLALQGREVIIFNGLKPDGLSKALTGKPIGTRLRL